MIFLIWRDDDKKYDAAHKVSDAIDAYERRFKRKPTVCRVSPATHATSPLAAFGGILVEVSATVPTHEYWMGG